MTKNPGYSHTKVTFQPTILIQNGAKHPNVNIDHHHLRNSRKAAVPMPKRGRSHTKVTPSSCLPTCFKMAAGGIDENQCACTHTHTPGTLMSSLAMVYREASEHKENKTSKRTDKSCCEIYSWLLLLLFPLTLNGFPQCWQLFSGRLGWG